MEVIELACNESFRKARMVGHILDVLTKNFKSDYKVKTIKRSDVWIYKFAEDFEIHICPLNKRFLNKAREWRRKNK